MGAELSTDVSAIPEEERRAVLDMDISMTAIVKLLSGPQPVRNVVAIAGEQHLPQVMCLQHQVPQASRCRLPPHRRRTELCCRYSRLPVRVVACCWHARAAGSPRVSTRRRRSSPLCRSTPGTGLYDNLEKYDLPYPEAVFDIAFFKKQPRPFFELARAIHPGGANLKPTLAHYFLALLHRRGQLRRMYTQNIDTLERRAGMPPDVLVEAHGSFASGTCLSCGAHASGEEVQASIFCDVHEAVDIVPRCSVCGTGVVKPDIVFFGEDLPERFHALARADMQAADMVLVLGSSLQVMPMSDLHRQASPTCPRVLINREPAGEEVVVDDATLESLSPAQVARILHGHSQGGFRFKAADNYRDVFLQGDCDDTVRALADACGWLPDLLELQAAGNAALDAAAAAKAGKLDSTPASQGAALPGDAPAPPSEAAGSGPDGAATPSSAPREPYYTGLLSEVQGGARQAAEGSATAPAGSEAREVEVSAAVQEVEGMWSRSAGGAGGILQDALEAVGGDVDEEP